MPEPEGGLDSGLLSGLESGLESGLASLTESGGKTGIELNSTSSALDGALTDSGVESDTGGASCTSKQVIGAIRGAEGGWASGVGVSLSSGDCSEVSGSDWLAGFSCNVACTGTVTLAFNTNQEGATITPATMNVVLDTHYSDDVVSLTVTASD